MKLICTVTFVMSGLFILFPVLLLILIPEQSPPIQEVIQAGVVPRFVHYLITEDFLNFSFKLIIPHPAYKMKIIFFEAAWALTNIASGTSMHTKVVIDIGVVPIFAQLLSSPSDDAREQAVWAP
ncbi:unnamed protein product [Coffea canephora]|uniref:Uncharacterized protein n=1 Tax=Coffea canephora TaxID=49390 RepID=A0A068US12_COFCA|nr:unnamed protein product [Coffea canephora]